MATSLAEQLRKLATPQSSLFFDSKKRDSILFSGSEAATKNRETIYDIGLSGLEELVKLNPSFIEFESTLFERTTKNLERAVESKEINEKLSLNIRKFMFQASPYFMLQSCHKCLEWLIRRFHINTFDKDAFLMLILPYHETKMFVRCVQTIKFTDPNDKWYFLSQVQKTGAPLSKAAVFGHGATNALFLEFIGNFTYNAVKELENRGNTLQTMFAFYSTSIIGALETAKTVTESHIVSIVRVLFKAFKSNMIDFTAASYMITAQLVSKVKLSKKLVTQLIEKISGSIHPGLTTNVLLLQVLIFETQANEAEISWEALSNFLAAKWIPSALSQLKNDGVPVIVFMNHLITFALQKIQEITDKSSNLKSFCESLTTEVSLQNYEAKIIIRSILDSYIFEQPKHEGAGTIDGDEKVISLDSDDEEEVVKDENVKVWFSDFLKQLERVYPIAFDEVVKELMKDNQDISDKKKNALKNVLGFLLKVSCAQGSNVFENLYHHNPKIRSEAVKYLVENFEKINISSEGEDLLKDTITERLNDDNPDVVLEVLKFDACKLIDLIGHDLLIHKLSKILCRCLRNPVKWDKICAKALNILTSKDVWKCKDTNRILLVVIPFLFPCQISDVSYVRQILKSDYAKSCEFLQQCKKDFEKNKITTAESVCKVVDQRLVSDDVKLPSSESLLETVEDIFKCHKNISAVHIYYNLIILAYSLNSLKCADSSLGRKIVELMMQTLKTCKYEQVKVDTLANYTLRQNKIPSELVLIVLEKVIESNKFEEKSINFLEPSPESIFKLKTFETLTSNYFKCQSEDRVQCNEVIKVFLNKISTVFEEKIDFLSIYCIGHVVDKNEQAVSAMTQVQVMQLLNQVILHSTTVQYPSLSSSVFINVLMSLTSDVPEIRKCGLELIETLTKTNIDSNWKFFFTRLIERKEEILMDEEQISLAIYNVFSSLKVLEKTRLNSVLSDMMKMMTNNATQKYLVAQLVNLLKHLTDLKLFKEMLKMASTLIDSVVSGQEANKSVHKFDEYESLILNIIILKIDQSTINSMKSDQFKFVIEALTCHIMVNSNDGKYVTPSILMLDIVDEELFNLLSLEVKTKVLMASVQAATFSDHPLVIQAVGKMFKRIELDATILQNMLAPMLNKPAKKEISKRKVFEPIPAQVLQTDDWRVGVALLELLQNKKKIANANKLVALLFQILGRCLEFEEQSALEYTKQIILSLLLQCCQKISPDGGTHKALNVDSIFKVESVMKCIRETQNPQTHHHALILLSCLAAIIPDQVLNNMMTIFTFMGSSIVRHDDSYSFQIIAKIIENVIPTLIRNTQSDQKKLQDKVIGVLRIFSDIILDVPEHRRVPLYVKLINTLEPTEYLSMFLGILLESQVSNYEKEKLEQEKVQRYDTSVLKNDEKSPKRLQIALAITTEFEAKIILETCTKMLRFLKSLPMSIEKQNEKPKNTFKEDVCIFNLHTHTDHQMRHFKYISLQFINQLLSCTQIVNKIAMLDDHTIGSMKQSYQSLILNILLYVPEVTKGVEHFQQKSIEKSWRIMLHICFDILESTISLLPPDMLLMVVQNLIRYKYVMVRKKVIELLINKLETNYFNECAAENMLKLLEPLCEICETIDKQKTIPLTTATQPELETIQQLALISLKLLARRLAAENVEEFKKVLDLLTKSIEHHNSIKINVLVNLLTCIAELTVDLKVHAIGHLAKFMPSFLLLLNVKVTDVGLMTLLNATVCSLLRIIETLPLFLSPYLDELILQLAKISPGLRVQQSSDAKVTTVLSRITKIWSVMSRLISTRVLIPAIDNSYTKLMRKKNYLSIESIMELLQQVFQNVDGKEFKNLQTELSAFFLKALQFRCDQHQLELVDENSVCLFGEQNEAEGFVIKAFVSLILKLSESSFRPLYYNVYEWAIRGQSSTKERTVTFYRLSNEIAGALKSLFVLFATELVQNAAVTLGACNLAKVEGAEGLYFANEPNKNLFLVQHILSTLYQIYLHDKQNFINTHRFDILMQPMVDQLENEIILESDSVQELLKTCLSQFAVAASDDILWKQLNYQILLKTRNNNPKIRLFALDACVSIAKKLGEDFQPLLPETIPFLSELLEDENFKVEQACQKAVQDLEKVLGEPLQKYF